MRVLPLLLTVFLASVAAMIPVAVAVAVAVAQSAQVDLVEIDPATLAVRVTLPEHLFLPPDSVVLTIVATRGDTGEQIETRALLVAHADVWKPTPEDAAALRALQAELVAWRDALGGDAVSASLNVTIAACVGATRPNWRMPVTIEISYDGATGFEPLKTMGIQEAAAGISPDGPFRRCEP
ncbi:MAG: hypothetical protein AAF626_03335 [Pseudomonadota bacterium]